MDIELRVASLDLSTYGKVAQEGIASPVRPCS